MYRIALVTMPLSHPRYPAFGITQLKSLVEKRFPGKVQVDVLYLNMEFVRFLGVRQHGQLEQWFAGKPTRMISEWMFRATAFPEAPDNAREYYQKCLDGEDEATREVRALLSEKRPRIRGWLEGQIAQYKLGEAQMVGLTSFVNQNVSSFAMARVLKDKNPQALVVMGGLSCESPAGQEITRQIRALDFVFSGSARVSFPQFVGHCLAGRREDCHHIDGVFSRQNLNRVVAGGACAAPEGGSDGQIGEFGRDIEIDDFPDLNYDSFLDAFEKTFPNGELKPALQLATSSGCAWGKCTFCSVHPRVNERVQVMRPEKAIESFRSLFRYADRCRMIEPIDLDMPLSYIQDVFPKLNIPPGLNVIYLTRHDRFGKAELDALAKAGVKMFFVGIESLVTSTLRRMRKRLTAFQNIAFLKQCIEYDNAALWLMMLGMPGDDAPVYEKYLRDIPLLTHLQPPELPMVVHFFRNSALVRNPEKYGLKLRPLAASELVYPFNEEVRTNLMLWFEDHGSGEYAKCRDTYWEPVRKALLRWQKRWYVGYLSRMLGASWNVPVPMLLFKPKGDRLVVHDSRSGKILEHEISDRGLEVLRILAEPCSLERLGQALRSVSAEEVGQEVAALQRLGLLFEEEGRFLSLVVGTPARWADMPSRQLLLYLRTEGLTIKVEGGKLRYRGKQGVVTEDIRAELAKRKEELTELLAEDAHGLQAWVLREILTDTDVSELLEGDSFDYFVGTGLINNNTPRRASSSNRERAATV